MNEPTSGPGGDHLDGLTPCSPSLAVNRAMRFVDVSMPYRLGSGDYRQGASDQPWTPDPEGVVGCDCLGLVCFAYGLHRSRPGFNRHAYGMFDFLDVEDDINSNSLIGDALHGTQPLFRIVTPGQELHIGDVLCYPTIMLTHEIQIPAPPSQASSAMDRAGLQRPPSTHTDWVRGPDGKPLQWIGHGAIVTTTGWARAGGPYSKAQIVQCYGPNDRRPAIRVTDASAFDHHDDKWPKEEHRTRVLRRAA